MKRLLIVICLALLVSACQSRRGVRVEDIPTPASLDALATALPLTQNAPPPPFNGEVTAFTQIDHGLTELPGWRYVVQLEFNGTFAGTTREATASARAEVSFNQLASARRVVVNTTGELLGQTGDVSYEAVRLGPDAFLVRDGACLTNASTAAATAADLRAGDLIGGAARAFPAGRRAVINGEEVFAFRVEQADLIAPQIRLGDGSRLTMTSSELWIAPARGVVVRYYVNLDVENAVIFDRQLPVNGSIALRYDLYDVGTAFNITVPFGC